MEQWLGAAKKSMKRRRRSGEQANASCPLRPVWVKRAQLLRNNHPVEVFGGPCRKVLKGYRNLHR